MSGPFERVSPSAVRRGWIAVLAGVIAISLGATASASSSRPRSEAVSPPSAAAPTRESTGPRVMPRRTMTPERFLESGRCRNRRVVGDIQVDDWSGASTYLGRRFLVDGCVLGQLAWGIDGTYGEDRYPSMRIRDSDIEGGILMVSPVRLTIKRSFVAGGFWAPCPNCTSEPQWSAVVRPMPVRVKDSLFEVAPGDPASGAHTEALHVMGSGVGYRFENTRFVQQGPYNGTQTAAIKFSGRDSRWLGAWFDFGGTPRASYYTVYIDGPGNVVSDCRIEMGLASYVYPDSDPQASYSACVDLTTGRPVELP